MATMALGGLQLEDVLHQPGVVMIEWWAPWSPDSQLFERVFAAASARHPGVTFGRVDVASEGDLASEWEVHSVPTLMVYRDGTLVFSHPGPVPEEMLDRLVEAVEALDMAEVRRGMNGHKQPRMTLSWTPPVVSTPAPEQPGKP